MGAFDEKKFLKIMELSSLFDFSTQKNVPSYIYLRQVAIEILSVLVTSASSERFFSITKYSLGDKRQKKLPKAMLKISI